MGKKEVLVVLIFVAILITPFIYKYEVSRSSKHLQKVSMTVPKNLFYHRYKEVKYSAILLFKYLNNSTFFCKHNEKLGCIICRDNVGNILILSVGDPVNCQELCQNCKIKYKIFYYFYKKQKGINNFDFLNVINNTTVSNLSYLSFFKIKNNCIVIGYKIKYSKYEYDLVVCKNASDLSNILNLIEANRRVVQSICRKNYCGITLEE